jgi:hypothetical protein
VEAQVLQEDDLTIASLVHRLLDLLAHAVLGEGHACAQQLLELSDNRLEAVLWVWLAVRPTEMAHEHDSFCAVVAGILDGGQSADDALVIRDLLVGVEGDVEVDLDIAVSMHSRRNLYIVCATYSDKNTLALEIDISNGELVG